MKTKHYLLFFLLLAVQLSYGQQAKDTPQAKNQREKPIKQKELVLKIKDHLKSQVQKETSLRRNDDPSVLPSHGYEVLYEDGITGEYEWSFSYIRDEQNRIKSATFSDTIEKENIYKVDVIYNNNGLISTLTIAGFFGPIPIPIYKDSFEYHDVYTDYVIASYSYEYERIWELYSGFRNKIEVDANNHISKIISESYNDNWDEDPSWSTNKITHIYYINNRISYVIDSYYSLNNEISYEEKYSFIYNQNEISGFIIQNKYSNDVFWQNKLKIDDLTYDSYKFEYVRPFILQIFESSYSETVYDLFRYDEVHELLPTSIGAKSYKEYIWSNDKWLNVSKTETQANNNEFEYVVSNWNNSTLAYELSKRYLVTKSQNSTQVIRQSYENDEWVNKQKLITYSNKDQSFNLGMEEYPYSDYLWVQNDWKLYEEWKIELIKDPQTGKHLLVNKSFFDWDVNERLVYQKTIYTRWGPFSGDNTHVKFIENNPQASIYPNPCNNQLYIQLPQHNNPMEIVISDINGKKVHQTQSENNLLFIDFSKFKQGVYFIKIANGQFTEIQKIVKY